MSTVPIPQSASEVPGPVPGSTMINAYVQLVGRMAYFWGYPMVNARAGTRSRLYSPLESFFDKSWRPSEIELVK